MTPRKATSEFIDDQISSTYEEFNFANVATLPAGLPDSENIADSEGVELWDEPEGTDYLDGLGLRAVPRRLEGRPSQAEELARRDVSWVIRIAYNLAVALFFAALTVGTVANKSLVAFAIAFVGLAGYGFGNYTADRFGREPLVPLDVATRLTVGSTFLALTALAAALSN
jgi:hypothetical protein